MFTVKVEWNDASYPMYSGFACGKYIVIEETGEPVTLLLYKEHTSDYIQHDIKLPETGRAYIMNDRGTTIHTVFGRGGN